MKLETFLRKVGLGMGKGTRILEGTLFQWLLPTGNLN